MLIDNGSDITLVKDNFFKDSLPLRAKSKCTIRGVTEGTTESYGSSVLTMNFGDDNNIEHESQIVSKKFGIQADGIIGRDFLTKHKCVIDYDTYTLTINHKDARVEVTLLDTLIMLPARSEIIRKLNIEGEQNVLVEQQEIQPGIFCANSISSTTCYVRFINTTDNNVTLKNFKPKTQKLENYHVHENHNEASINAKQNIEKRKRHIHEQTNIATLPDCYRNSVGSICDEYNDVFFVDDDVLGVNNFYKQKIVTINDSPSYIKNYKLPFSQKTEIENQVQDMLREGKIEPSFSPFNSPLLVVNKKTGEQRVVIDYRKINKNIVADKFPLPRIDDILDQLGRAKFFTVLDLKSGFHQVELEKESREITAFSTNSGHYQFNRLPFGLKISPNSFQRMMSIAMAGLTPEAAFLYIDDLVVFGCSIEQHNKNLIRVLERLRKYNLKLNPKKCLFLQHSVTYLGHVISEEGIAPDKTKFDKLEKYPNPENADEVRRFVAFCNYYRKFVPNFAELANPLNALLRKKVEFNWSQKCQEAFEKLKKSLIKHPILQHPNFEKEFTLTTDASNVACGAILSQEVNGVQLPIAYASKAFSKGEKNKSTIEKELTAIHWAVMNFKPYLYGKKFTIFTDHKPLIYLFTMKNPTSKLTRMRWDLEEFDYEIKYIQGKTNHGADALSRICIDSEELKKCQIIQTRSKTRKSNESARYKNKEPEIDQLMVYEELMTKRRRKHVELKFEINKEKGDEITVENTRVQSEKGGQKNRKTMRIEIGENLLKDPRQSVKLTLALVNNQAEKTLLLSKEDTIFEKIDLEEFKSLANREKNKVKILIYKPPKYIEDENEISKILHNYHHSIVGAHTGVTRMIKRIGIYFKWKNLKQTVVNFVKNCTDCKLNKVTSKIKEPMKITKTPNKSFEIIALDTIGPFSKTPKNNRYALTIQDELTKYVVIIPIPNKEAPTLARAFVEGFVLTFGTVKFVKTDLGTEYVNQVFKNVLELLEIEHRTSTAYHPQTIGGLERNHKTLNEFLRKFVNDDKDDWDDFTKYYEFAYNTTPHSVHKFTPYELVFSKKPLLPIGIETKKIDPLYNLEDYAKEAKFRLQKAIDRAKKLIIEAKQKTKIDYDKNSKIGNLKIGDIVTLERENRRKLDSMYTGKFMIEKIEEPNSLIKNLETNKITKVHNNRLKII
ncbi:MAG TPA: hypothetical protein DD806_07425 [Flavobacterium sp.]|nr:hypothetical protein [Flavobacterium sp.]